MSVQDLLAGLDKEQKIAVTLQTNGVASAGAGSGKTKVLASRYAWLVMEMGFKVDEILTLTFTNKAVSEMYSRIYRYLLEQSDTKAAAQALKDFHKARISTLDSFSAGIARSAAARYGISPDFSSDDTALGDLAREAALRFVLDNREDPAIRTLLGGCKIRKLANEIFARVVLKYSPISSPLEPDKYLSMQKEEILRAWREKIRQVDNITGNIIDALPALAEIKKNSAIIKSLQQIFKNPAPPTPDLSPLLESTAVSDQTRQEIKEYFDFYSSVVDISLSGNFGGDFALLLENLKLLKGKKYDGLFYELMPIANYSLNFGLCAGVFGLIKQFQEEFNNKKRETGLLSFNDIAHLAVDALRDHPDIRKVYKDSLRMIMIDEFQDNNALQRDLIFLLAENPERKEKDIAAPGELEKDRMFFVGDEKQSIYRFRGADVEVFRSLGKNLFSQHADGEISLIHNYRSRPRLIAAFNRIFGGLDEDNTEEAGHVNGINGIFLPPGPEVPAYEAVYNRIRPPEQKEKESSWDEGPGEKGPLAHFCFLDKGELPEDDTEGISPQDLQAVFIAGKIRDMVRNKEMIPKRTDRGIEWVECTWGDFAILQRSYSYQGNLEKYFREFGVPYNTDRPTGLFSDAPIMDFRAYLRLLVYPEDRIAYAALIRSPFMRLSDLTLAVCMLNMNMPGKNAEPFTEENETLIPKEDLELYRRARERYRALREASRILPAAELITKLWFEEGYRYETLWSEAAQVYEGLFDLFFSLASDCDARGKSLPEFIEYFEDVMTKEVKPDARDIPGEGESGVKIMSIHKSKGLEFPVVFIYDWAQKGSGGGSEPVSSFHEKYGLILSIPQAEELPEGGNYFRDILQREEKSKDTAELRRLLYVAMTRAEYRIFLTFILPSENKEKNEDGDADGEEWAEEFTEETIRRRLIEVDEKYEGRQSLPGKQRLPDNRDTFLKLLAGVLPDCPSSLCALETIPVLTRAEISEYAAGETKSKNGLSQRETALAAAAFYEKAEILPVGKAGPVSLDASKIRCAAQGEQSPVPGPQPPAPGSFDTLIEKAKISAADFGTLVHAVLEARLNNRPCVTPQGIRSRIDEEKTLQNLMAQAENLAESFISSELGKRWAASNHQESEFSVITSVAAEGRTIAITGQMDLLFEEDKEVVVVDFKTDRTENPEDHYGQLAAYYRAAGDIFGKPVSAWLFYLRSGRAVDITENVKGLSLEEMAAAALERQLYCLP